MASNKANPKDLHLLHEGNSHDDDDDLFFSSSSSSSSSGEEERELEEEEEEDETVATTPSNQRRRPSRRIMGGRDRMVDRTWQMRRSGSPSSDMGCRLLVRPGGSFGSRHVSMDIDEVRACKDLGLEFPHDWSLELSPSSFSSSPRSSGTSPASSLRISSPGDDPRDVKERLKVWAHAVAWASASSSFRSSG